MMKLKYELIMIYSKCHWGYSVNHLETYSGEMNFVGFLSELFL